MVAVNSRDRLQCAQPYSTQVHDLVVRTFQSLRPQSEHSQPKLELHGDEPRLYGRSYWTSGMMAMWIVDAGVVEFYSRSGKRLKTIRLKEPPSGARRP